MDCYLLIKKALNVYSKFFFTPFNKLKFRLNRVSYGKNLRVRGNVFIYRHYENAVIQIGDNVTINSARWANPIGCGDRTYFQVNENARLIIGNNCGISNTAITCEKEIVIDDNVTLGSGCHIYDTDFHPLQYEERIKGYYKGCPTKRKAIHIGEGAFIGAGCYILKGVTIGKHAIVGAGAVVTKDIPDGVIWGGNPAIKIR
ncbi:2,3,4,5-tetrahydropyridine-2,6-dicarboxylate N-acetyltransferase [anaerobic digester metagenome]